VVKFIADLISICYGNSIMRKKKFKIIPERRVGKTRGPVSDLVITPGRCHCWITTPVRPIPFFSKEGFLKLIQKKSSSQFSFFDCPGPDFLPATAGHQPPVQRKIVNQRVFL